MCYSLLRDGKTAEIDDFLNYSSDYIVDFNKSLIKEAAFLRVEHRKKNISMADCIGYCLARVLGIKFLTGDKEFEHFENVEFVK